MRAFFLTLLLLGCLAVVYLLVIMGDDPAAQQAPQATTAPMAALPQSSLTFGAEEASQVRYYFTQPVLTLAASENCVLQSATLRDYLPEGMNETVREVCLQYALPQSGGTLSVSSIWPASYLNTLARRGLLPAVDQNWTLAGLSAVCMSDGTLLHIHAQRGDVLYQVEGSVDASSLREALEGSVLQE